MFSLVELEAKVSPPDIQASLQITPADGLGPFGWVYDETDGTIVANVPSSDVDFSGKPFNTY